MSTIMAKVKTIDDIELKGKRVFVRVDFNVPLDGQKIRDTTRIDLCIPFIKSLMNKKAKLFLISHLLELCLVLLL